MKANHRKNGGDPRRVKASEAAPRLGDDNISVAELRARLGDVVGRVSYKNDRILITKHGKPVAALISSEDLEFFERIEDRMDNDAADGAQAETRKKGGPISWPTTRRELNFR